MIVQRTILNEIKYFLKRKEYIALTGPRQSGKTTILEILRQYLIKDLKISSKNVILITFEDRKLIVQFEDDPVEFIKTFIPSNNKKKLYLMIDEFQYAENSGKKLKLIYDTVKNLKIIITGSSSLEIKANIGKYMVGRIISFMIFPFNFSEYLSVKNKRLLRIFSKNHHTITNWILGIKPEKILNKTDPYAEEILKYFVDYCTWGGYPEIVLTDDIKIKHKILNEILNNYILHDIKSLLELSTDRKLLLMAKYLSAQIGNILVYQNLCNETKLDYRNMEKHLNILEETYVCRRLSAFYRNKQKELSKNPKIFFHDLGFRNNLIDNMNVLFYRPDKGSIVENNVFIQLNYFASIKNIKLNFWRTKTGAEVDFVLTHSNELIPIEVKYSEFTNPTITRSFRSFIDTFKPKRGIILTMNYFGTIKINSTLIVFFPVYYV